MCVKDAEQYAAAIFECPFEIVHEAVIEDDGGQAVIHVGGLTAPVFDVEAEAHDELGHVLKATPADFKRWAELAEAWWEKRNHVG